MKRFLISILFLTGALSLPAANISESCVKDSLRYKGETHVFWTYTPTHLSADAPLLICLHGYGGRAERNNGHLVDLAEEKGFVVCFPQGLKDGRGKDCWNVGYPSRKGSSGMTSDSWSAWSGIWSRPLRSIRPMSS